MVTTQGIVSLSSLPEARSGLANRGRKYGFKVSANINEVPRSIGEVKHNRYQPMKKSSFIAQQTKRTDYLLWSVFVRNLSLNEATYLLVVEVEQPTIFRGNVLVTACTCGQRGVHMDIVTRIVKTDQGLK